MKSIIRFNGIVISLTTSVVFGIWYGISKLIINYPDWFGDPENEKYNLLGLLVMGLISIGVYRLFFLIMSTLVNSSKWLKKAVFSSEYIEGTWVGFYIGVLGNVRYLIETFEQNLDGLVIKGTSYDENNNLHSFWTSESINLDSNKGELSYQYKVRTTREKPDPNGIAYFSIIRDNNRRPANILVGFSADSHLEKKCKAMEYKLSPKTKYDINEALSKAQEFYNTKKDIVFNYPEK
ncbi:hypothetical protein [Marinifilum fragile]|uniref:hypothetical protein n=1 Tax=Marinifilum fragile TaxID=570161 RepID=UPI002AAA9C29|nr:hypothetical protein [Marinifilum fragile]